MTLDPSIFISNTAQKMKISCGFGHVYWKKLLMENLVFAQCKLRVGVWKYCEIFIELLKYCCYLPSLGLASSPSIQVIIIILKILVFILHLKPLFSALTSQILIILWFSCQCYFYKLYVWVYFIISNTSRRWRSNLISM